MVVSAAPRVLVVGSGVIGLRTAQELLKRNASVVLRSPKPPLDTSVCSQGAGGLWMPFHCDDPRVDRWATETLDELHPIAQYRESATNINTNAVENLPLVERVPAVVLHRDNEGPKIEDFISLNYQDGTGGTSPLPTWSTDPRLKFQHLTVEMLWWQNSVFKLRLPTQEALLEVGYKHAWFFETPIIDSPRMLEHMLDDIQKHPEADVNVETGVYYESMEEIIDTAKSLGCTKILNAAGLGASDICQDSELVGARGVLLHYNRDTCVRTVAMDETEFGPMQNDAVIIAEDAPWGSNELPSYIIPRGNMIVAGGSYLEGDTEVSLRPRERQRLMQNAYNLGIDTNKSEPVGEWAGFRPYRPISRLEIDSDHSSEDLQVVHSYGYGGSGWTVYVGCAKEATNLLLQD